MDNTLNITMDQGSSLNYIFNLKTSHQDPIDLTGYDVRMQIRKSFGASSVLINCTLANSKVVLASTTGGQIGLHLLPPDTSAIRFNSPDDDSLECVYDLELITPAGAVYKVAKGTFTLTREVTR